MNTANAAKLEIPEWTAELVDAFETEARQLETLGDALRRQRDGIARDEIGPVHDSVSAIHRVLLTLDEARKRRRTLLEILPMREVTEEAGEEPARLGAARDRLIAAARELESELSLSRRVLETALQSTDEEIRTLLEGLDESSTYADEGAARPVGSGRLVDRQV